jgi:hypothetical protein
MFAERGLDRQQAAVEWGARHFRALDYPATTPQLLGTWMWGGGGAMGKSTAECGLLDPTLTPAP